MAHDLEKKWRSQDVKLEENVDFSSMLLSDRVLLGLKKAGFKKPSPIQLEAIPIAKIGKDLIVQAKSGTGKTLIFVITALEGLRRRLFRPQVMILAPTREIATQICSVVQSVASAFHKLTCFSFIGGLSVNDDRDKCLTCQIVVGTPGRLKQLVSEKALPVNSIRLLVFDEADQLLHVSFKQDIEDIFKLLPIDKQVIATSATYPAIYRKTLLRYLREPYLACLNSKELALLGIVQYARVVKGSPMPLLLYKTKLSVLEEILKTVKFSQCLVFCNGIQKVEILYKDIKKWGFSTTYISSAKEQYDRLKAVDRLKHFKCKVLVSSDVTSRGIDAENVDFVINFDLPFETETYMHRVGRAGRYGSIGVAISILEEKEVLYLGKMETAAAFKTFKLPDRLTEDLIQKARYEEGEYLIEDNETDSDEMFSSKLQKTKNNNSNYHNKVIKPDNENIEEKLELTSNVNCNGSTHFLTEVEETKPNLCGANAAETVENGDSAVNIEHFANLDSNESNHLLTNQRAEKQNLTKSEIEEKEINIELHMEQNLIREKDDVERKVENLENEHLSEYDLSKSDCISYKQKHSEKNSESSYTKGADGNMPIDVDSLNGMALAVIFINEKCNSYKVVENDKEVDKYSVENNKEVDIHGIENDKKIDKHGVDKVNKLCVENDTIDKIMIGVKNTNAEISDFNSEVLVNKMKESEVDSESVNGIEIKDSINNKEVKDNLPGSVIVQSLKNADKIYEDNKGDCNNVQKTELQCATDKSEINIIAKTFIDQHELNREGKKSGLEKKDKHSNQEISEGVKPYSITDLSFYKSEYFYKVFKKYQGESELPKNEAKTEIHIASLQSENFKPNIKDALVQSSATDYTPNLVNEQNVLNSETCFQTSITDDEPNFVNEQIVISSEGTAVNLKQTFEKPKSESTPLLKTKVKAVNYVKDLAKHEQEPVKLSKPLNVFQEISDESDFDDLNEESTYSSKSKSSVQFSSDSCSDSCSSEESDEQLSSDNCSDTSSSTDHSTSESSYHRKTYSRKIHSSSSVSNSSGNSKIFDTSYHSGSNRKRRNDSKIDNHRCGTENYNAYNCSCLSIYPKHSSMARKKSYHVRCAASNRTEHSVCSQQCAPCHRRCFLPSEHRCHIYSVCHQMPVCSHWHRTFYNQWQHIQNCIGSTFH